MIAYRPSRQKKRRRISIRRIVRTARPTPLKDACRAPETPDQIVPLRELERRAILNALRATQGSVGRAAKALGIGRATLYRRISEMDIGTENA